MTPSSDEEFREFMLGRWPGLVRFAYGLTGDAGLAEDLAQTALAKAYASWGRVRRADDPDAYIRRILLNSNKARFRKRRVVEDTEAAPPETASADGLLVTSEERSVLLDALRELPPRQRAVVLLRYWDDLSETQAAEVLGCSVGNVKSQASRALARLRTNAQLVEGSRS